MGCAYARDSISSEEQAITLMESQLEYFKNSCIRVDQIMRKYSNGSQINSEQWVDICDQLELKTQSNPVSPKVEVFYSELKQGTVFPLNQILVLGILLSNGMSRQKARLLFEVFDENNLDWLGKEKLNYLLQVIKEVAVDRLPELVHNSTHPPCSSKDVMKYKERLDKAFVVGKGKLMEMICGVKEGVHVREFVRVFDNERNGRILTSYGFRIYLIQFI